MGPVVRGNQIALTHSVWFVPQPKGLDRGMQPFPGTGRRRNFSGKSYEQLDGVAYGNSFGMGSAMESD